MEIKKKRKQSQNKHPRISVSTVGPPVCLVVYCRKCGPLAVQVHGWEYMRTTCEHQVTLTLLCNLAYLTEHEQDALKPHEVLNPDPNYPTPPSLDEIREAAKG